MTATLVIHPVVTSRERPERSLQASLEEAVGLAHAIALEVKHAALVRLQKITPATYIGKGKAAEFAALIEEEAIGLAIMDCALTPVQQRNLEKAFGCKVIDRTALILEIFGARARTAEGKLQVELASLTYQKSRLVRSWTHLERQRGGFGFLGGPGESQIELDRRMIGDRIIKIKKQLANVVRTRALHRTTRRDVPYPLIALVGYTNAGKSTLFNRLTHANVTAQDMLFATLDPTIREAVLPSGLRVLLSDTVGFISNLPTELIAAFRATLEEVLSADMLLHVRDIAHEDTAAQRDDVRGVLKSLFGKDAALDFEGSVEIHNKIDQWRADHNGEPYLAPAGAIPLSAITGEGCDALLQQIDEKLSCTLLATYRYRIPHTHGRAIAWLYANGQVIAHAEEENTATYEVRLSAANAARFHQQFGYGERG
ncbi:MAG: GTPase HflX [Alphaproteobacteria bacterium]|nr:GTPase HflX [Alphaproteobacteria bacterium]